MTLKSHSKPLPPQELKILTHLNSRMNLSAQNKKYLYKLQKGYEGERKLFHLLEKELTSKCIPLYSLLLESNQTEFQIDNLLIYENTIIVNEIKNFEGDFFIKDDKWYVIHTKNEIRNPTLQLKRSQYLLGQLLQEIGVNFQIEAYIVFVNPAFTLYQAPYDKSLIFPTQLTRYIQKLNSLPANLTRQHTKLAGELVSQHLRESSKERLPVYQYDELQKGIPCSKCHGFLESFNKMRLKCKICDNVETIESAIIRNIAEFHLLFPEEKITATKIHDWCQKEVSKYLIRKILFNNLTLVSKGRSSYYIYRS